MALEQIMSKLASAFGLNRPGGRARDAYIFSLGVLVTLCGSRVWSQLGGRKKIVGEKAWTLSVQLRFTDEASRDAMLEAWAVIARFVRDEEPFCLSYEAVQSDKDPLLLIVNERYTSKKEYMDLHRSSAAFDEFRPKLKALQDAGKVSITGESGNELGLGFV
eukprot:TRINITY_DN48069_c0_g1_i1.p1 TRINITY_DN48069_c0_g1~~TRINITY_DN48069_c0_g1_i1.p1  ORF type:complete len:174 (-),score=28.26 TRINITY_DN48069_c0_g1_i1:314-799(-)